MSLTMVGVGHAADPENLVKKNFTLVINSKLPVDNPSGVYKVSRLKVGGAIAYCVDLENGNDDGDPYKPSDATQADHADKVELILSNGFGAKSADELLKAAGVTKPAGFTDIDAEVAAYIGTQTALWNVLFPGEFALYTGDVNENVEKRVAKANNGATWYNGENDREFSTTWWTPGYRVIQQVYKYLVAGEFAKPTLTITPATASATVGGKAGPFTVKITGGASDAKLSVAPEANLLDKDGNEATEAADGGQVFVDCKTEGTFTITAKSTYTVAKAKFWAGKRLKADGQAQRLVTPVKDEKELTATATATCTAAPPGLPVTGAPVVGTVGAGLGLVVVGAGLFLMRRRRRIRFTA